MNEYKEEKSTLKRPTLLELTQSFLNQRVGHNRAPVILSNICLIKKKKKSLQVKYHSKRSTIISNMHSHSFIQ